MQGTWFHCDISVRFAFEDDIVRVYLNDIFGFNVSCEATSVGITNHRTRVDDKVA